MTADNTTGVGYRPSYPRRTTTPNAETAKLVQAYAQAALDRDDSADQHLIWAIVKTDATSVEACCHMGRAMLLIEDGLSDLPYRLGGEMCDPRKTEIAHRLGVS